MIFISIFYYLLIWFYNKDILFVSLIIEVVKLVFERFNDKIEFCNLLVELMFNKSLNKYFCVFILIKLFKDLNNWVIIKKKIKDVIDFCYSIS